MKMVKNRFGLVFFICLPSEDFSNRKKRVNNWCKSTELHKEIRKLYHSAKEFVDAIEGNRKFHFV